MKAIEPYFQIIMLQGIPGQDYIWIKKIATVTTYLIVKFFAKKNAIRDGCSTAL